MPTRTRWLWPCECECLYWANGRFVRARTVLVPLLPMAPFDPTLIPCLSPPLPHPHPLFRLVRPKILQRSTTHSVSSVPPADAVTGISQSNPTWQVAERRVAKFLNKEKSRDTMSATKKKSISKKMFTSPFRRRKAKEQPDATLSPETTEPVAAKALSAEEVDNTGPYSEEEGFCEPDSVWCGSTCAIS